MAGALAAVILILILAYWCSRLLGKRWVRTSSGGNMRVIESLPVGVDKQLLLLELQGRVYLLGVSAAGIQMLTEAEGELKQPEPVSFDAVSRFREILEKKKGENQ